MKNSLKLACLVGATLAVSACSGYNTYEQSTYQGRMGGAGAAPAPAPVVETHSAQPIFKDAMRK
ncbi:MAG: hypothetical protein H6855_00550 [Rhodospirillales bacterium]|nr:hypothetical protein [Rhodospirillales bacterium]MCB9964558.1 hypothetical protein [Rhodospirillales bacterium]